MTTPRPPAANDRPDGLKQRYLDASAAQNLQPGEQVRQAALAHAQMVAAALTSPAATEKSSTASAAPQPKPVAANRWNFSLVASVAIAAIGTLLALQFDRSELQDKAVVMGTPSVTAPSATVPSRPEPPASVQAPSNRSAESNADVASATPGNPTRPDLPRSAVTPPAAQTMPRANQSSTVKEFTGNPEPAEALARPAPAPPPAPAPALAPAPSSATAEPLARPNARSDVKPDVLADSATANRATQAASPSTRSKSAPMADAKSASSADAESAAPPFAVNRRAAAVDTLPANVIAWHQAARTGQIVELDRLLQLSGAALVNTPDDKGRTALMLATLGGHMGLVQRLVSAGADASLKDAEGKTAGQMARQLGLPEISNILNKQPASQ